MDGSWQKINFAFHLKIKFSAFAWTILNNGEGNGAPLQYSCLENPMDGGAWWAAIHGVTKSWTWLRDFTFHFHAWEKEMATHSSDPAWRISGTGEPGGLPSVGSRRVGHDWSDLAAAVHYMQFYYNFYYKYYAVKNKEKCKACVQEQNQNKTKR